MPTAKKTAAPSSAPADSAPKKTAQAAPKKTAAPKKPDEAKPDKIATHDVVRPIVIAGTAHVAGDGVTLSGLDAAVLYNEGYVRRH